jgi:hypothetical protein
MPSTNTQCVPNRMVIVACPVSRCEVRHVAGVGVLMAIRHIERAEQFESGERTTLQALLDPEQALEIGEALRKSVQALELGKALKKALKKPSARKSLKKKAAMLLPAPGPEESAVSSPANA